MRHPGCAHPPSLSGKTSPVVLVLARCDEAFAAVREAGATSGVAARQVRAIDEAKAVMVCGQAALLVVHVGPGADVPAIAGLVRAAAKLTPRIGVVAVGEPGFGEAGLELLRSGAADYLERPLNLRRLAMQVDVLTAPARFTPARVETTSPLVGTLMDQVARVAGVDTTVLLLGETGTGKTRLARILHEKSHRAGGPFLVVNCAALTPALIESELFGHLKGAFTGADRDRDGKCTAAAAGTLFLDEVDSLPPELQAKLLRLVEDREYEPVGSDRPVRFDARLIAASNRPLEHEVASGRFRSDLYYRLNVVGFHLPALRDRASDIPSLAAWFLAEYAGRAQRDIPGIDPRAVDALVRYTWPGNVRELRNVIERAVALRPKGVIELADLTDPVRGAAAVSAGPVRNSSPPPLVGDESRADGPTARAVGTDAPPRDGLPAKSLARAKEEAEFERIVAAMERNHHNKARAAAELGISRMTLYNKLRRYGLVALHV